MEGAPGWMAVHERVYEVDGTKLSGWLVERPGKPLAVFYGGNGMDAGVLASATQEFDECAWLLVNYRGTAGVKAGLPRRRWWMMRWRCWTGW